MRTLLLTPALLLAPVVAAAQPAADPAAVTKPIAPFLDNQALAVVRLRVSKLTPEALKRAGEILGWDTVQRQQALTNHEKWIPRTVQAGVEHVFLIVSLADIQSPLAWAVPAGEQPAGAYDFFSDLFPGVGKGMTGSQRHGYFVMGSDALVRQLTSLKPVARPDLAAALAAAGDADIAVGFSPSPDHRRVVAELFPKFPAGFGGGSTKAVTDGVRWVAISASIAPKMSLRVVIQASSPDAAATLAGLNARAVDALGTLKGDDDRPLADVLGADFPKVKTLLTAKVDGDRLVISADDAEVAPAVAMITGRMRDLTGHGARANNLKQIAIALHNHHDEHGQFPDRAGDAFTLVDPKDKTPRAKPNGKPLLSWRVYILPYVEQLHLFQQFKLDEPWDSEHNRKLIAQIPPIYRGGRPRDAAGKTRILAPVLKGGVFEPAGPGTRIQEVTDGTSQTIMVVEAAEDRAVVWTKPDDLEVDAKDPKKGLFDPGTTNFLAALADGSVHTVPKKVTDRTLLHLFLKNDGNAIDWPK